MHHTAAIVRLVMHFSQTVYKIYTMTALFIIAIAVFFYICYVLLKPEQF